MLAPRFMGAHWVLTIALVALVIWAGSKHEDE
jgi:low affinity Fe/Cu permease